MNIIVFRNVFVQYLESFLLLGMLASKYYVYINIIIYILILFTIYEFLWVLRHSAFSKSDKFLIFLYYVSFLFFVVLSIMTNEIIHLFIGCFLLHDIASKFFAYIFHEDHYALSSSFLSHLVGGFLGCVAFNFLIYQAILSTNLAIFCSFLSVFCMKISHFLLIFAKKKLKIDTFSSVFLGYRGVVEFVFAWFAPFILFFFVQNF